ncbi:MAG: hypothetical protein QX189_14910 [Methylococcales bacterium]
MQQVARMELAECGAFRNDSAVSRIPLTLHTGYESDFASFQRSALECLCDTPASSLLKHNHQ